MRLVQTDGIAGMNSAFLENLQVCPGAGQGSQAQCLDPILGRWCAEGMRCPR